MFDLTGNHAYNVDCMELMREVPDKYFDLAVCDPPYGISVTSAHIVKNGVALVGGGGRPFGGKKNHDEGRFKKQQNTPSRLSCVR